MTKSIDCRKASKQEVRWLFDQLAKDRALRLQYFREHLAQNAQGFNLYPPITPIPPGGVWVYPFGGNAVNSMNATSTNSSSTLTVNWPCTTATIVGQPISGLNIQPNTTVSAVGATTLTLSQNTASSGAATGLVTITANLPNQSAFSSSVASAFPSLAAAALDIPGCMFAIPENQTLIFNAASVFFPSNGEGYLLLTSGATTGATIQYNNNGSFASLYPTLAAGTSQTYYFTTDGGNIRITSPGTSNATFTFIRFRAKPQF